MLYFLQHKPPLGKLTEEDSSSKGLPYSSANYLIQCSLALLHTHRPSPGADLVDLGKATVQDNDRYEELSKRLFCPLSGP